MKNYLNVLLQILVICTVTNSYAQDSEFITYLEYADIPKSSEFFEFEKKLKRDESIFNVSYMWLGAISKFQKNGNISLQLPGLAKKVKAVATHVDFTSDAEFSWHGRTEDGLGDVVIVAHEGRTSIHVFIPPIHYEIFPVRNLEFSFGYQKHESAYVAKCREAQIEMPDLANSILPASRESVCAPSSVRVLFLYTANAASNATVSFADLAAMVVSQYNQTIYNSAITNAATAQLAGVEFLQGFVERSTGTQNAIDLDLADLINNTNAKSLRNAKYADIVVLFTHSNYGYYGTAGTLTLEPEKAFAIVQIRPATGNYTGAHEMGHLYGARHATINSIQPSYARAYTWDDFWDYGTLMSSTTSVPWRLLYFSNPNVKYNGKPTGTSSQNNARRVTESHPIVRDFRSYPRSLGSYTEGPAEVTTAGPKTFECFYSCGTPPYTFSWAVSSDGVNYSATSTITDKYVHYFYPGSTGNFYARSTIADAAGQISSSTFWTAVNIPFQTSMSTENGSLTVGDELLSDNTISLYPNPAASSTIIRIAVHKGVNGTVEIIDSSGAIVKVYPVNFPEQGEYEVLWNETHAKPGIYVCRLTMDGNVLYRRIFRL